MTYVAPAVPSVGDLITAAQGAVIAADLTDLTQRTQTTTNTTTAITGIAGTDVVLGTAPSVAGDGVKTFTVTGSFYSLGGSVAGVFTLKLKANGTVIRTGLKTVTPNGTTDCGPITVNHTPGSGSCVYTLEAVRSTGTAGGTCTASATDPIQISVQQIA